MIRDAEPDDIRRPAAVYTACIAADPDYLPFLTSGDEAAILAWFRLKPLVACLVAERSGAAGRAVAGSVSAGGPSRASGGAVTRDLIGARESHAVALGADRLWMRCAEGSASHLRALSHGWTWRARTEFDGPAACQSAILLACQVARLRGRAGR